MWSELIVATVSIAGTYGLGQRQRRQDRAQFENDREADRQQAIRDRAADRAEDRRLRELDEAARATALARAEDARVARWEVTLEGYARWALHNVGDEAAMNATMTSLDDAAGRIEWPDPPPSIAPLDVRHFSAQQQQQNARVNISWSRPNGVRASTECVLPGDSPGKVWGMGF